MKEQISLYDCLLARYPTTGDYVRCKAGHKLGSGRVHKRQVDRNDRLIIRVCQLCKDICPFEEAFIRY